MFYSTSNTRISTTITGTRLARRDLNPVERAFVAVDLIKGRLVITNPTIKQSAALVGANVLYIRHALRADPADRALIEAGIKPLQIPSDAELDRIVAKVGREAAWEAIVRSL